MKKKTDLRVLKTKKLIFEAFVELVEEKGYEAVTVQDIATKAMINRATFYAHFKDKQDLYDHIFDVAITTFAEILDTDTLVHGNRIQVKKIEFLMTKIFTEIRRSRQFFIMLTEGSSSEQLRKKLAELLYHQYADTFAKLKITESDMDVPIDFIIEYMTSIFVGTVHWWVTADTELTANQMARLVIKLVGNGHLTVLGIEIDKEN